MLTLLRPILFQFLGSQKFKQLVIDLLSALVKRTDNKLDDNILELVKKALQD